MGRAEIYFHFLHLPPLHTPCWRAQNLKNIDKYSISIFVLKKSLKKRQTSCSSSGERYIFPICGGEKVDQIGVFKITGPRPNKKMNFSEKRGGYPNSKNFVAKSAT